MISWRKILPSAVWTSARRVPQSGAMGVAAILGSLLVVIALWPWGAQNLGMIARSGDVEVGHCAWVAAVGDCHHRLRRM